MTERLLQFIWQFQYYNKACLTTSTGLPISIIFPGRINHNQGPDFLDAQLRIEKIIWAGSVELHVRTSDWIKHSHGRDCNYQNVILHVVWIHDEPSGSSEQAPGSIAVLELQMLVSKLLLLRYEELMNAILFIPCGKSIGSVPQIVWDRWKDQLLAERLPGKSELVRKYLEKSKGHWDETLWWLLARNFGLLVNANLFELTAQSIPFRVIAKHRHQIFQLEALLIGQAGLLSRKFRESYPASLQQEYQFLRHKYQLLPVHYPVRFLRMRPRNFPALRLAQLASVLKNSMHLFSAIRESRDLADIKKSLEVSATGYWEHHYKFDRNAVQSQKNLGTMMINCILINTVIPIVYTYGLLRQEASYQLKALRWIREIDAENNSVTKGFENLGIKNKNAFDSQALIQLKSAYCQKKKCLECGIGNSVLANGK